MSVIISVCYPSSLSSVSYSSSLSSDSSSISCSSSISSSCELVHPLHSQPDPQCLPAFWQPHCSVLHPVLHCTSFVKKISFLYYLFILPVNGVHIVCLPVSIFLSFYICLLISVCLPVSLSVCLSVCLSMSVPGPSHGSGAGGGAPTGPSDLFHRRPPGLAAHTGTGERNQYTDGGMRTTCILCMCLCMHLCIHTYIHMYVCHVCIYLCVSCMHLSLYHHFNSSLVGE